MSPTLNKTETVGAEARFAPPSLIDKMTTIADELYEKWDVGQRSGKLLKALNGALPRYRADVAEVRTALAAFPDLLAAAKAYEAWEADLILNNAWDNKDGLPSLTPAQYAELLRLQGMRNAAIAKATGGA